MEIKSEQLWPLVQPRLRSYLGRTWDFGLVTNTTGTTTSTVTGWLADQVPPSGERLIKLWHLLEALGLESPELAELPGFNRYCGELLTFGVITMKELQEICELANSQSALLMLRGKPPMRPQLTVEELYELHDETLQVRRADLFDSSGPDSGQETSDDTSAMSVSIQGGDVVVFTASMLGTVLPLVRHLDSDQATPADRSRLRALVGNDDMFDLSNILNHLCSERARDHGRKG